MEHNTSLIDIIINVSFQIINIGLFFFLFIKFAWKSLTDALDQRILKEKRLADAEHEYDKLISEAQKYKDGLIAEALIHKKNLITEAKQIAIQEKLKIIEQANREAKIIIDKASQEAELKWRDLDAHFVEWVKNTALTVVRKLFASKKDIQEWYVKGLVEEFTASYKK